MYTKQIITRPDGSKYVQLTRIGKEQELTIEQKRVENWLNENK